MAKLLSPLLEFGEGLGVGSKEGFTPTLTDELVLKTA